MKVKIADVAAKAGVSNSAVSLVFNNKPGVGSQTRARILNAARELDYKKPPPASREKAARTIRFLKISRHGRTVSRDHDTFIADYIEGIDEGARVAGYNLEVSMISHGRVEEILEILGTLSADGAIILGTEMSFEEISKFNQVKLPFVLLDTYYDYLSFDFVDMNNIDAAHTIVDYFLKHGHQEIGFIRGNVKVENFRLREKGYCQAMKHFGLPLDSSNIIPVDATFTGAYNDTINYLKGGGQLPPALFISNDIIAYGCIKAMRDCQISVPEDVSVIGFDDLPMSAIVDPPLTTFSVSKRSMGKRAFELCAAKLIEGRQRPSEKVLIDGRLIERASVTKR